MACKSSRICELPDLREQLQKTLGDQYTLEQELGGGGMSRVFVAHEAALGRKVVVKVLPQDMAAAVSIDRFRREIQLAAQLQHPHIVPLLHAGETEGLPFFTMPFVKGESLRTRLSRGGELPLSEAVRILREVASALAYAHENHVVHRDIKPENILISGGSAMVTDFGVAKAVSASSGEKGQSLTSLGVALGTPAYMAPEQATADPNTDHRADIYALGVVAYEMLTGSTPFSGRSPQAMLAAQVTESPDNVTKRRSTIPPLLAHLVMCCLEKRPADRPQNAGEVMHELDALTTPSGGMTPTAALSAAKKPTSIPRAFAVVGGLAALIIVSLMIFKVVSTPRSGFRSGADVTGIAVLPFENRGSPEGQEFTDGMTEEITNRLSSLRALRVIGRQSVRSYSTTTKTPQQIATEMGVEYVLTGTVRWEKGSDGIAVVRVSPVLLRGSDAAQVWASAYQTPLSGMFEVQTKVATEVANALNVALLAPEKSALSTRPTNNIEAYSYYLRGTQLVYAGSRRIPDLNAGIEVLEKAVAADPAFALAYALLGRAHTELFWYYGDRTSERLKLAKAATDKALALNPDLPEGHYALGNYYYHGFLDYSSALKEFQLGQQLRPDYFEAIFSEGAVMRRQGDFRGSIARMQKAIELEPRLGSIQGNLASSYLYMRDYANAEQVARRALVLDPQNVEAVIALPIVSIARDGDANAAVQQFKSIFIQIPDAQFAASFALSSFWPFGLDPEMKRAIEGSPRTADWIGALRHDFYVSKMLYYRWQRNERKSRAYADSAVRNLTALTQSRPDDGKYFSNLAIAHAGNGNGMAARAASDRALSLTPVSKDAFEAPDRLWDRGIALTLTGDYEEAISALEKAVTMPSTYSRNFIRLDPLFAPLRGNPRFQKLVGSQ